ncbi:MAG TPA: sulfotransferase [Thermoanaerobaculia bacterium]|nr:sulfotransferase [Thermoanaerobaculia bacterium]
MSQQLIICGMHRSGTSLVASVLRQAGLDIGREEFGPGLGQPRGHFEDHDFYHFHEAILAAAGRSCFTAGEALLGEIGEVDPAFEEQARALAAARADRPFWGWKEPRTCLFLDLWDRVLPEARYLFLYRHPVDVALSLWRRNIDLEVRRDPWLAFRSWEVYNRRLLAFRDRHPERCFLAHAPALAADFPGFFQRLSAKLDLPLRNLRDSDFRDLYEPEELAPSCQPPRPAWEELIPEALEIYGRLEESADLPSFGEPAATGRQRWLLQGSEFLLYSLLEARQGAVPPPDLEVRREFVRLRLQEEALRKKLEAAEEETRLLREITGSRSFAVVRAWWWLRRRLA